MLPSLSNGYIIDSATLSPNPWIKNLVGRPGLKYLNTGKQDVLNDLFSALVGFCLLKDTIKITIKA